MHPVSCSILRQAASWRRLVACLMLFALAGSVMAQDDKDKPEKPALDKSVLDKAVIEARIKSLSSTPDAAGEDNAKAIALYQETLTLRDEARAALEAAEKFRKEAAAAPAELEKLSASNSQTQNARPASLPDGATLADVNRELDAAKAALADARSTVQAHAKEAKSRLAHQAELPDLIAKNNSDLATLAAPELALASDNSPLGAAYQRYLAQQELLRNQGTMLEAELDYLEATPGVFSARGAMLARRVTALSDDADTLQKQYDSLRLSVASDKMARAREDVAKFTGSSAEERIARETLEYAEAHGGKDGISRKLADLTAEVSRLDAALDRITKQYASAQRRTKLLEDVSLGIDAPTGRLLRAQRQALPTQSYLREDARQRAQLSAQAQLELIGLEERYSDLITQQVPSASDSPELYRLWKARLSSLRVLLSDYRDYVKLLNTHVSNIRQLLTESAEFARFVDERLLWIPSTTPIGLNEPEIEIAAIRELFKTHPADTLMKDAVRNYWIWLLALLPWCYLVVRRRSFRARLKEFGHEAARRNCTSFEPTSCALGFTVLLALPIPWLMWFLAGRSGDCAPGVSFGLVGVASFLSTTIFLQLLAHPEGLLSDHFRMESSRCQLLRRSLDWFIPAVPIPLFFTLALPIHSHETSAGRLSFIVLVILTGIFLGQLLKPSKGMVHWRGRPADRFAKACWFLGIAVPFILAVGAAVGFFTSAQELRLQAYASVALVLFALFVAAMLYRWILVSRRRFAVQQALARRAAALAERDEREPEPGVAPQSVASLDEVKANALKVVEVEEQTTRLVRAATIAFVLFFLVGIWQTAIPALSALDRITLWTEQTAPASAGTTTVTPLIPGTPSAAKSDTDSTSKPGAAPVDQIISLQDLLIALIILFLTIVAGRNVPGLIELMFFRHMHLKPGSSFAFTTTIRYVIVVCGVCIACAKIGITWGKVQWIAAAVTLGIGFGLQEIFANFVAGLIILFERPIRLGDIVTIAGVDGKVTQIRIRATTIRQFNGRELIVPNKSFITGQLVNWTLSDNGLRIEIPVGLAYGSDTELARKLMLDAALAHPKVLDEPAPMVVFNAFADSSLAFALRVFVAGVDDLAPVQTDLNFAIDNAFRDADIEIAFPQSDIRIRALPDLSEKAGNPPPANQTEVAENKPKPPPDAPDPG